MIREYKKEDNKELLELFNICFNKDFEDVTMNPTGKIFVYELDNKIVGMLTLDILNDIFKSINYGYINNVCVNPMYGGKGIGDALMKYTEQFARNNNCKYIMLTSNKKRVFAHKLYLKNNYEIVDTCVFKRFL